MAQLIELIESILQRLQLNSTSAVVGNYHEFWREDLPTDA